MEYVNLGNTGLRGTPIRRAAFVSIAMNLAVLPYVVLTLSV
jgi:hypothetical protein